MPGVVTDPELESRFLVFVAPTNIGAKCFAPVLTTMAPATRYLRSMLESTAAFGLQTLLSLLFRMHESSPIQGELTCSMLITEYDDSSSALHYLGGEALVRAPFGGSDARPVAMLGTVTV